MTAPETTGHPVEQIDVMEIGKTKFPDDHFQMTLFPEIENLPNQIMTLDSTRTLIKACNVPVKFFNEKLREGHFKTASIGNHKMMNPLAVGRKCMELIEQDLKSLKIEKEGLEEDDDQRSSQVVGGVSPVPAGGVGGGDDAGL